MKLGQTHGGKGSARRNTDDKKYAENWDKIFGKHKQDQDRYAEQLKNNGVEPANKKHYGEDIEKE
jgi:hypothetical protein